MTSNPPGLINKSQEEDPDELMLAVRRFWKQGERGRALNLLRGSIQRNSAHIAVWRLLAELAPGIEEKVQAYESILRLVPADEASQALLSTYRHFQEEPEDWAIYLEDQGHIEEAISVYKKLAGMASNTVAFDRYYHEIIRLENHRLENIKHVTPMVSVIRLSLGLPILYTLLALMQSGFRPAEIAPEVALMGLPLVAIGSFLTALSTVRSSHLFLGKNINVSYKEKLTAVRMVLSLTGWLLVLFPYAFLIVDALIRMQGFEAPPLPLFS
jgi:tetratricopeptide (TPR) repeat protein